MEVEHFSNSSIACYLRSVRELCNYSGRMPNELFESDIYNFLEYIKNSRGLSRETVRNYLQGLRFMYRSIYKRMDIIQDIPYPKQVKHLPVILSGKELLILFRSARSLKHRMVLKIAYGGGLRRNEICRLRLIDVDTKNLLLRINNSKGNKDRYTLLPRTLLPEMDLYLKIYKPEKYFFNGSRRGFPYSEEGVRWVFRFALEKSGITKKVSLHNLRHSFASHLLAMGTNIFTIQKLLGHDDIRTTMIYLQVNHDKGKQDLVSPLDRLQK